jgi:hypothetical protein
MLKTPNSSTYCLCSPVKLSNSQLPLSETLPPQPDDLILFFLRSLFLIIRMASFAAALLGGQGKSMFYFTKHLLVR